MFAQPGLLLERSIDHLLPPVDVELQRSTIRTHIECDRSPHHEWQIHITVSGRETAQHRNMVRLEILAEHSLHTGIVEVVTAVGELTQDDSAATVEHARQPEHVDLPVDVVHRLLHLLDKENDIFVGRSVLPPTSVPVALPVIFMG